MMLPGVETRAWSKDVPAQTKKVCHCATVLSAHMKTTISPSKKCTVPGIYGIRRLTGIWGFPTPDRYITPCPHCQGVRETLDSH